MRGEPKFLLGNGNGVMGECDDDMGIIRAAAAALLESVPCKVPPRLLDALKATLTFRPRARPLTAYHLHTDGARGVQPKLPWSTQQWRNRASGRGWSIAGFRQLLDVERRSPKTRRSGRRVHG